MENLAAAKYKFGNYELDCSRRLVTRGGEMLALNSKAFELLQYLVENHGKLVTKSELLENVWPDQFVEENNLAVQVSALRKAFGDRGGTGGYIATVPGKGYSFVAEVTEILDEMVVEKHSISRVVIDEDISAGVTAPTIQNSLPDPVQASSADRLLPARHHLPVRRISTTAIAAVIIFSAIGAGVVAYRGGLGSPAASVIPFVSNRTRQLTTNGNVGSAALSPDGKMFAYTTDELGQKSLWMGYVDGGNHIQLRPPSEAAYRSLAFSPDGSQLYYSIRDVNNSKGALFRTPVFGGAEEKVLDEIGNFSLSPDGTQIAIGRADKDDGKDHIDLVPLDHSPRRDLVSFSDESSYRFESISWSPDGARLAVGVYSEGPPQTDSVAVIDVLTGEIRKIEHRSLREITKTAWLKDGDGILITAIEPMSYSSVPQYRIYRLSYPDGELSRVTSDRSNYGRSWLNDAGTTLSPASNGESVLAVEHRQLANIWVAPANDAASAKQITFGSFGKYDGLWGLDWTVDGKLVYTTSDTESQFLATMDPDGSGQRALTSSGKIDSVLTVTNDGRYIIFHSDRGGGFDIWRSNTDGSDPKQLTFGGKSYQAAPSADGKWVYYKSWVDNIGGLYRVPIEGGEAEMLNDKETSWLSFSPDGKYFAATYRTVKLRLAIFSAETNQVIKQFDIPKGGTLSMGSRWTPDSLTVVYRDNNFGYWKQPIDGGDAKRLEGLPKEKFYNFAYSKDGKWFAFVRGQELRDVILIENEAN